MDTDFEKKSCDKRTKQTLKETLKILNDYVENNKKSCPQASRPPKPTTCCDNKGYNEKEKEQEHEKNCCCDPCVAKCVVASFDACDAPEIDKLLNTVYTTIPNFPFTDNGTLITLANTTATMPYRFPDFNYYVALPAHESGEVRLLWPLVWMVREIVQRLTGRFTLPTAGTTGYVSVRLVLNVLSQKLIKDPAQAIPTLNVNGINNGICICDSPNAVQFDYSFLFAFTQPPTAAYATLTTPSTVSFSAPNIPVLFTFTIDPVTLALSLQIAPSAEFIVYSAAIETILSELGTAVGSGAIIIPPALPGVIGSIPVNSPAHYYSFVPSQDAGDGYWVATSLESLYI